MKFSMNKIFLQCHWMESISLRFILNISINRFKTYRDVYRDKTDVEHPLGFRRSCI